MPPGITGAAPLTEQDAVAIALWNSPGLETALSELGLARADLVQAGVLLNPNLQVLFGIGSKPFEFLVSMPIQAIWQRPKRISAARLNLELVSEGLVQNGIDLVRDTRIAYAELDTARRRAGVEQKAAELSAEIAGLTQKRLDAGDISELDYRLARLAAIGAADRAARAQRDAELAREQLRLIIGARDQLRDLEIASVPSPAREPASEDELVTAAVSSRPDLRAAELGIEAAGKRAGWERSKIFNMIAPALSSKEVGADGFKTGPAVSVEIPVFDRNQGGISRAEAELRRAILYYAELAEQVRYEVRGSRLRLLQALETLNRVRDELVPVSRETQQLAEKAYEAGDISYLDLQQARRPLLDAFLAEESAVMEFRRARAELERAIGRKL